MNLEYLLGLALWLAGIGHFCVLCASFQVPFRLGWRKDLAQLTPFNRKLMWVYGGTIVLTITAFGIFILLLHNEFLARDRAAAALATFIAVFWTFRILIDFFVFEHKDWPTGIEFVIGHFFLTCLFAALALTNWAVLAWYFL
jgi:alginate O-acetyltransferase complex protein AlgI